MHITPITPVRLKRYGGIFTCTFGLSISTLQATLRLFGTCVELRLNCRHGKNCTRKLLSLGLTAFRVGRANPNGVKVSPRENLVPATNRPCLASASPPDRPRCLPHLQDHWIEFARCLLPPLFLCGEVHEMSRAATAHPRPRRRLTERERCKSTVRRGSLVALPSLLSCPASSGGGAKAFRLQPR